MKNKLNTIPEAIEAIKKGEIIIVVEMSQERMRVILYVLLQSNS